MEPINAERNSIAKTWHEPIKSADTRNPETKVDSFKSLFRRSVNSPKKYSLCACCPPLESSIR